MGGGDWSITMSVDRKRLQEAVINTAPTPFVGSELRYTVIYNGKYPPMEQAQFEVTMLRELRPTDWKQRRQVIINGEPMRVAYVRYEGYEKQYVMVRMVAV